MRAQNLFSFVSDISKCSIPKMLNNPFSSVVPEIARIAAKEFQTFLEAKSSSWPYDFTKQKGKMFGVLVIQREDNSYAYLGAVSGKLPTGVECDQLVPSVFDDSSDDYFINKGMTRLTEMGVEINETKNPEVKASLKEKRRLKSIDLQQQLFEHYHFQNLSGKTANLLEIFKQYTDRMPPSAAGECAAPKLLQYAIANNLKPIAIAEFWWGKSTPQLSRIHNTFHPACTDKCRPILEYMLEDTNLYANRDLQ